jgi:hypothetical protein
MYLFIAFFLLLLLSLSYILFLVLILGICLLTYYNPFKESMEVSSVCSCLDQNKAQYCTSY